MSLPTTIFLQLVNCLVVTNLCRHIYNFLRHDGTWNIRWVGLHEQDCKQMGVGGNGKKQHRVELTLRNSWSCDGVNSTSWICSWRLMLRPKNGIAIVRFSFVHISEFWWPLGTPSGLSLIYLHLWQYHIAMSSVISHVLIFLNLLGFLPSITKWIKWNGMCFSHI